LESDIESSNKKKQWITSRELKLELEQIEGVTEVIQSYSNSSKVGRKRIVEWTIDLLYRGQLPDEGLSFLMPSHQSLPYRAVLPDDDDDDE